MSNTAAKRIGTQKGRDLTTGPIPRQILLFALPLFLSSLVQLMYNTVDVFIAGRFIEGSEAMAAVGASSMIVTLLIMFFNGMSVGANVVAANAFGSKDGSRLRDVVHTAVAVSLLGGLAISVIGFLLSPTILRWTNTPDEIFAEASSELTYVRKHYSLPENTLRGPVPIAENFGVTRDKAVIRALLERPEARDLIGDQKLSWNEDIELLDDTPIYYYLDETILVLTWQELTGHAVGTFSEIFIADGSQIIRRVGGDRIGSDETRAISAFARESNAVLAISADFYHFVYRDYGAIVYQRELYRFNQRDCDSCFFTADGDMLFAYKGQFADEDECRQYIKDNDVVFSVAFGPVIIDDGVDVMPKRYRYGEIDDTYARAVIGMLGEHHYLTMDINRSPIHYNLVTLRVAADAMIAHGAVKAYTLDGGKTAETVFNGQVINPLQDPWEKALTDAICFVSAYPDEGDA